MTQPDFTFAKALLSFVSIIGFLLALAGVIIGASMASSGGALHGLMPFVAGVGGGFILVAMSQMGRATVVTAEASHAILMEVREGRNDQGQSRAPSFGGAQSQPRPVTGAVVSRSLVKVYKEKPIERTPNGIEVDGLIFDNVIAAERYIDGKLTSE